MRVLYSLLSLFPAQENAYREFSYPHYISILNFAGIEFPMMLNQIKKFETLNDISITMSTQCLYNEKGIVPIWLTDRKRSKNLLYMEDDNALHSLRIYLD